MPAKILFSAFFLCTIPQYKIKIFLNTVYLSLLFANIWEEVAALRESKLIWKRKAEFRSILRSCWSPLFICLLGHLYKIQYKLLKINLKYGWRINFSSLVCVFSLKIDLHFSSWKCKSKFWGMLRPWFLKSTRKLRMLVLPNLNKSFCKYSLHFAFDSSLVTLYFNWNKYWEYMTKHHIQKRCQTWQSLRHFTCKPLH
jgi:hypothetical protein